jgi:hypothetical protein
LDLASKRDSLGRRASGASECISESFTAQSKSNPSMFQLTAAAAVQEAKPSAQQCASINCEEFITASDANTFCVRRCCCGEVEVGRLTRKIALIKYRLGGTAKPPSIGEEAKHYKRTSNGYLAALASRVIFTVIYSREKIIIKREKYIIII